MSCRSFTQSISGHVSKAVMLCLATAWLVALAAIAVAQENEGSESRALNPVEQALDEVGDVAVPGASGVPTKSESDAARRLREGKTLVVGPSKKATSATQGQSLLQIRMMELQLAEQRLAAKQEELAIKHEHAVAKLADALRNGNATDEAASAAVAAWQKHQAQIERERKALQSEIQQLESLKAQVATEAARQQQQQRQLQQGPQDRGALPADATTKVYSLRHSRAPAMAQVLSEILGGKNVRMAVDERTNSLIVLAEKGTDDVVEALLMKLDQSVGSSAKKDHSGETLQLRIVWLLDGDVGMPPTNHVSPQVVEALHELGFSDPEVVCQQVTTLTLNEDGRRGEFNFTVPVLIKSQSWDFEGHGQIEAMADERFNLKFDLGFKRIVPVPSGGGFVNASNRQGAQLGGSIYTPLGHYTVMGTTTFVATSTAPTENGDQTAQQHQHLSAFVVYLDRAREFPAKAAEEKQ